MDKDGPFSSVRLQINRMVTCLSLFSCGSFPPSAADPSTTTVWNRRRSASVYGPQFSILPFLWTFSTACMQSSPCSMCSARFEGTTGGWSGDRNMHWDTCHHRLPPAPHSAGQAFRQWCGSHSNNVERKLWRQKVDASEWGEEPLETLCFSVNHF